MTTDKNRPRTTSHQPPTTDHQPPATNHQPPATSHLLFALFLASLCLLFASPLIQWALFSFDSRYYSHLLLIPPISLYFFFVRRRKIFAGSRSAFLAGGLVLAAGALFHALSPVADFSESPENYLASRLFLFLLLLHGGFLAIYGTTVFRRSVFPLFFLFFALPLPEVAFDAVTAFLQHASVEMTGLLLQLSWVPFYREGTYFSFPGFTVEVARQCGGIRSAMALTITTVVAAQFLLRKRWARWALALSILPITILQNALRITVLCHLALYFNESFVAGDLHDWGGRVFFVLALCFLLIPTLWLLSRLESSGGPEAIQQAA